MLKRLCFTILFLTIVPISALCKTTALYLVNQYNYQWVSVKTTSEISEEQRRTVVDESTFTDTYQKNYSTSTIGNSSSYSHKDEVITIRKTEKGDIFTHWVCVPKQIQIAIHYKKPNGDWVTKGWYQLGGSNQIPPTGFRNIDSSFIADIKGSTFYLYAEAIDWGKKWGKGDKMLPVNGSSTLYPFTKYVMKKYFDKLSVYFNN